MKLEIAEPCDERWESMAPRAGGRFCDRCQHTVIDLSKMTRREAEKTVRGANGYVCGQLAFGPDDEAVFKPEPKRLARWAGGLVLAAALTAGCSREDAEVAEAPCTIEPSTPGVASDPIAAPVQVSVPPMQPIVEAEGPRIARGRVSIR